MKLTVQIHIDVDSILQRHGCGASNEARIKLANEVAQRADPYVPMQTGRLKNGVEIAPDGSTITYPGPYARVHWYGKVMRDANGRAYYGKGPKKETDEDMQYHGSPMRGPKWVDRMLIDHKQDILQALAEEIGGKPK